MSSLGRQSSSGNEIDYSKLLTLDQDDFDVAFFDRILERKSGNVDVIRRQAELHSKQGNHPAALRLDQQLVEMLPEDGVVRYNLACSLALMAQISEAVAALRTAIELGYQDFARIESDSDLDTLRENPEFVELLKKHQDDLFDA